MNEPKPCSGVLFKNDRKTKETHSDYSGTLILEDGTECWLNAWIKHGKSQTFMSLSFKPKQPRQETPQAKVEDRVVNQHGDMPWGGPPPRAAQEADDIPF